MNATAQECSQCGFGLDMESIKRNTCRKCRSAVIVTSISHLERLEKPAIQKYIGRYVQLLKAEPNDHGALLALGVCYLQQGLHDLARGYFDKLIATRPDEASGYYYSAICLFQGRRPRNANLTTVRKAETLLDTATAIDPSQGRYEAALAIIRRDYYIASGLTFAGDTPDCLLKNAGEKAIGDMEIEQISRLLKVDLAPMRC